MAGVQGKIWVGRVHVWSGGVSRAVHIREMGDAALVAQQPGLGVVMSVEGPDLSFHAYTNKKAFVQLDDLDELQATTVVRLRLERDHRSSGQVLVRAGVDLTSCGLLN